MVDLTSDTWTTAERVRWRQVYTPMLSGIALIFCIIAQVLYFKFPRLLKFPRCILSWLNFYNIYYCLYVFFKWLPVTPWHERWASKVKPGSPECVAGIWINITQLAGPISCNTLLCLTIFLVTVLRVNIEDRRRYFWGYFIFTFVYPPAIAFPAAFSYKTKWKEGKSCNIDDELAQYLIRTPNFIFVSIQIFLVVISLYHIRKVMLSIKTDTNFPVRYIVIRFLATLIAQVYNIMPSLIAQSFEVPPSAIWERFANSSHAIGPALDALVMIFGNPDFMDWVKKKYNLNTKKTPAQKEDGPSSSTRTDSSTGSKDREKLDIIVSDSAIELEDLHLTISSAEMGTSAMETPTDENEIENDDPGLQKVQL